MSELREAILSRLTESFTGYYDVTAVQGEPTLRAVCAYHARNSRYVLHKRAELWAAEQHEYLYLHGADVLDDACLTRIFDQTLRDGLPRVEPHAQHMSTNLTAVAVCDRIETQAQKRLEKLKKRQEYRLSLHGWMEFSIVAVDLSTGEVFANPAGKPLAKDLRGMVAHGIKQFNRKGEEKTI